MIRHNNSAFGRAPKREAMPRVRQGLHHAAQLLVAISCLHAYGQTSPSEHFALAAGRSGDWNAWRASMSRVPLPKNGCFKASYPSTEWLDVPCTTPPSYPLQRTHVGGTSPDTVGGGGTNDFAALVSGLILAAEGSFISVTPGITEMGNTYSPPNCAVPTGTNVANAFTLQLNTNTFASTASKKLCSSGSTKSICKGWQQFTFDNNAGQAYIQYWLENYGTTGTACPTNWYPSSSDSNEVDCYTNSEIGVGIPFSDSSEEIVGRLGLGQLAK